MISRYKILNEFFKDAPFKVIVDSSHIQLTGIEYGLEVINENQFHLSVRTKDHFPCDLKTEKFDKTLLANINIDKTISGSLFVSQL